MRASTRKALLAEITGATYEIVHNMVICRAQTRAGVVVTGVCRCDYIEAVRAEQGDVMAKQLAFEEALNSLQPLEDYFIKKAQRLNLI